MLSLSHRLSVILLVQLLRFREITATSVVTDVMTGGTRKHVVGNQEKLKKGVGRYRETGKGRVVNRRKGDKFYIIV